MNFKAIIIGMLLIGTLSTINTHGMSFGARSDIGFQDGVSDCQSGTSDAINGHSNAGHHSAAYMEAYNRGLSSCNTNSGTDFDSNNQPINGPSNTRPNCTGATFLGGALGGIVGSVAGPAGTLGGIGAGSTYLKNLCESQ